MYIELNLPITEMQLFLSPTGIQDYLKCSKKLYYRRVEKAEDIEDFEIPARMRVGSAVHKIIELNGKNYDAQQASSLLNEYGIKDAEDIKHARRCLSVYYSSYSYLASDNDLIEYYFKVKLKGFKDVTLVGKIDRIFVKDGTVIDWKTGYKIPESIDDNIQFMLYYYAYKQLYKEEPKHIYMVNLSKGKMIEFNYTKLYFDILNNEIIPKVIDSIKYSKFYREGIFNGSCPDCKFKGMCWTEV